MNARLFTIAYWPPISQCMAMKEASSIWIEGDEHFQKQSYRNRMNILSANGILPLSIPIVKETGKIHIRNAKIDYKTDWQRIHWKSIESAYNNSPYFLYYKDNFIDFYQNKQYKWLFDYDLELISRLFKVLSVPLSLNITTQYQTSPPDCEDLRSAFHPKILSTQILKPYIQVFDQKFGFVKDLSIIDLICNLGPESNGYIHT